jgi:hypothetical protein
MAKKSFLDRVRGTVAKKVKAGTATAEAVVDETLVEAEEPKPAKAATKKKKKAAPKAEKKVAVPKKTTAKKAKAGKKAEAKEKVVAEKKPRPERDYSDFEKTCPRCPVEGRDEAVTAVGTDDIAEKFGWRMINKRPIPQSWCKQCRGGSAKKAKEEAKVEAAAKAEVRAPAKTVKRRAKKQASA